MRKRIAAAAMGAALLAGGGVGAALMTPVIATAADESTSSTDAPDEVERGQWVKDALQKLVDADTITQAQADAVAEALEEARPERGPMGGHFRGPGPGLTAAATALGIEESELRTALQDGQTIAEVAAANNVDVAKVIDAIVAELNSHLDEAVSNGRLTQAQADEMKANATERATALVNGERPAGGPGRFGPGGPPPGAPGSDDSGSTDGTSSNTETSATI